MLACRRPLVRAGFGVQAECHQRNWRCLQTCHRDFHEREDIAIELAKGTGIRAIARKFGRSPSKISREVRRNAATRGVKLDYRASAAQWHAGRATRRPRPSKLATNPALREYVEERLAGSITNAQGVGFNGPKVAWKKRRAVHRQSRRWSRAWSPEQIAHRLRIDYSMNTRPRRTLGWKTPAEVLDWFLGKRYEPSVAPTD